jgi:hypothetical protein
MQPAVKASQRSKTHAMLWLFICIGINIIKASSLKPCHGPTSLENSKYHGIMTYNMLDLANQRVAQLTSRS